MDDLCKPSGLAVRCRHFRKDRDVPGRFSDHISLGDHCCRRTAGNISSTTPDYKAGRNDQLMRTSRER